MICPGLSEFGFRFFMDSTTDEVQIRVQFASRKHEKNCLGLLSKSDNQSLRVSNSGFYKKGIFGGVAVQKEDFFGIPELFEPLRFLFDYDKRHASAGKFIGSLEIGRAHV